MEITANRKDLLAELNLFSGVVDHHPTDPMAIFSNVCFSSSGGNCEMKASGGEIGLRSTLAAEASGDGMLSIPVGTLTNSLKHGTADEVTLTDTERSWVLVKCGQGEIEIPGRVGEAPKLEEPPDTPLCAVSASRFQEILRFGSHAVPGAGDAPPASSAGAQIEVTGSEVRIVSSDHSRLAYASVPASSSSLEGEDRQLFGLGARTLSELAALCGSSDGEFRFSESGNHLFFEFGDRLLVSAKLAERLPDYEHVIPRDCPVRIQVKRQELLSAVGWALPWATGDYSRAKLTIDDDRLVVEVASVRGQGKRAIESVSREGESLSLHVNLGHLRDFARRTDSDEASLEFQTAETAFLLRPVAQGDGEEHLCVGMPLV